jgi:hypothetical protein
MRDTEAKSRPLARNCGPSHLPRSRGRIAKGKFVFTIESQASSAKGRHAQNPARTVRPDDRRARKRRSLLRHAPRLHSRRALKSSAGERQLAKVPLPGARCEITPYNPTGVAKDHPPEQSVYCFRSANEDAYHQLLDRTNAQVAECLGQDPQDDTFTTRLEYQSNLGSVRVSADQMTNDWAVSVTVMPLD